MPMWLFSRTTNPLHKAVLEDDRLAVDRFKDSKWQSVCDKMGFTPLEIARLLGRQHCAELLGGSFPTAINVQMKGEKKPAPFSLEEVSQAFGIRYYPSLAFQSYAALEEAIAQCPYLLRCSWLIKENHEWANAYREELSSGMTRRICIKWINDILGYGAFLEEDVSPGMFIAEYTGLVRRLYADQPDHNAYCFAYPTRLWCRKNFIIDALRQGNVTRFFNHSEKPSLETLCAVDRGLLHQVFIAEKHLKSGTELTFNYGEDYWVRRNLVANADMHSRFRDILERKVIPRNVYTLDSR